MSTRITIAAAIKEVYHTMVSRNRVSLATETAALKKVMNWGKLSKNQACLFSYFSALALNGESWFDFGDIQNYIDCELVDYYEFLPEMDDLILKGFFALRYDSPYVKKSFTPETQFYLPESIIDLISYNDSFKPYKNSKKFKTDTLSFLFKCKQEGFVEKHAYYDKVIRSFYKDNEFLMHLIDFDNKEFENDPLGNLLPTFFIYAGIELLKDYEALSVKEICSSIDENEDPDFIISVLKSFKDGKSWFIKNKIFEIDKTNLADNISIKWGDKARKTIFKGSSELFLNNSEKIAKELGKINYTDIKEKTLFYNDKNVEDVKRLEDILDEDKYNDIRKRLDSKNMPKGVIVLMYGVPGTGKTETVMQLAKKTGRNVLHVNIQEIRSMWVGETEKNTKRIFEAYRRTKGKKPILLFNEADAIVSTRTTDVSGRNSSVNKMENAMQNIILEELENFDGILIMTTNLQTTLDDAFDRRILFKMKFENPTKDIKKKIWKNKIESLTDEEAEKVAEFDFSGGQIENVRRKITIDEVLYGNKPTIDKIMDFCKKEKLQKEESRTIGFGHEN